MGGGDMGGGGGMPQGPRLTIRWMSAEPVKEALTRSQAENAAIKAMPGEAHVIAAVGFPMMRTPQPNEVDAFRERMKKSARLVRKGKDPVEAAQVGFLREGGKMVVLWVFPKTAGIDAADKEVSFEQKMGPMEIKAKFVLKDMMYQGKLSL
ncbi:MAG: hypothetical protein FJW40_20185 [Acidobacteria bacterium]|nr:hypothetical protein [Acidobacteriota bacterium]